MKKRPININPFTIRLPAAALVSITHRLSGILVFLLIPALLWALQSSLTSPTGFEVVRSCLTQSYCKIVAWILLAAITFHVVAGIRHLLMDVHIADSKQWGRYGAYIVMVVTVIFIVAAYSVWG